MNARLSHAELTLAPSVEEARREHHESWLYFHLDQAAKLRQRMDRAPTWSDYDFIDRQRQQTHIAKASEHYRALVNLGGLTSLLAEMALAEGLTP